MAYQNRLPVFLEWPTKECLSHSRRWIAIRTALLRITQEISSAIDERFMKLPLPHAKNCLATFASIYATTFDSFDNVKDRLYDILYSTLQMISRNDLIILLGDFNARVVTIQDIWQGVIDHHGVGNINSSCLRMLPFSSELDLTIKDFFQLRNICKTS